MGDRILIDTPDGQIGFYSQAAVDIYRQKHGLSDVSARPVQIVAVPTKTLPEPILALVGAQTLPLSTWHYTALTAIAKECGWRGWHKMRKETLIGHVVKLFEEYDYEFQL